MNSLRTSPSLSPRRRTSERGAVVIIAAIFVLVLIGFVGLAIDTAHVHTTAQQLQAAADAAALSAARHLSDETFSGSATFDVTRQAAIDIALANKAAGATVKLTANTGNASDGDIVVGLWNGATQTFTPSTLAPNAVKVTAHRTAASADGPLDLMFGAAFAAPKGDVSRTSIAHYQASKSPYILVLHPSDVAALYMNGNPALGVADGRIMVNSCAHCAIKLSGNPSITASKTATNGTACAPAGSISGTLEEHVPVEADPLAYLLPDTASWNALKSSMAKPLGNNGKITATGAYSPGYYPKGLDISSSTAVTLLPGRYMFGDELDMGGQSVLVGTGVTIFMDFGAKLDMAGSGSVSLVSADSGAYQGIVLFTHRGTAGTVVVKLGGNGVMDLQGTVYVPSGAVDLGGTSTKNVGQIICEKLEISGTSQITGLKIVPSKTSGLVFLVK